MRRQHATQAVRHQHDIAWCGAHNGFQRGYPVGTLGREPLALLDTAIPVQALPARLPVLRAGILPAGQDQDSRGGTHGVSSIGLERATFCRDLPGGAYITYRQRSTIDPNILFHRQISRFYSA